MDTGILCLVMVLSQLLTQPRFIFEISQKHPYLSTGTGFQTHRHWRPLLSDSGCGTVAA